MIKTESGFATIKQRQEIKKLILNGDISQAIKQISQYYPMILDLNNLLHFKLLRLNLVEMIRNHKFNTKSSNDRWMLARMNGNFGNNIEFCSREFNQ